MLRGAPSSLPWTRLTDRGRPDNSGATATATPASPGRLGDAGGTIATDSTLANISRLLGEIAGVRHCRLKRSQGVCPAGSLDERWTEVREQTPVNAAENEAGAAPGVGVVRPGQVLGAGKALEQPVILRATFFSRKAEEMKGAEGPGPW